MSKETINNELKQAIKKYFNAVCGRYIAGNIESSYNKPIAELFETFDCKTMDMSGERKGKSGENIDIKLWHGNEDINDIKEFAGIEVKVIGGIDKRAREQNITEIKKYGNVILTDNLRWEFYTNSETQMYNGFELITKNGSELKLDETKLDLFIHSIMDFITTEPANIKSSNKLAEYMARHASTIRVIIRGILNGGSTKPMFNELSALLSRLQSELLPELSINDFADMYAQTIVYGLFIARYNDKTPEDFTLGEAITNLSQESHLLKQFFGHITTTEKLHPTLSNTIEKLCKLFATVNLHELLDKDEQRDTIVHFYEEFLSFYDPQQRKNLGAYYTPVQVVRYMVDMVDKILVNDFNIEKGLANNGTTNIIIESDPYQSGKKTLTKKTISVPQVAILDPADGTGTFEAEIIKYIKQKYFNGGNASFYKKWIQDKNGLLSRLVGFEIMITSYVVARLKIRRTIAETLGEIPEENLPTNIFLTNTLAKPKSLLEKNAQQSFFDFSGAITEEAENADKWKCRRPIKVIIGNPPYNASSVNFYDISAYKFEVDGKTKLQEKNPKWLNDDYVKFIRFAEQHIENDGNGVLAFISNNGYLDNPTFRGMRSSLLRTFDKIHILNLHGNSNKQETCSDGSKDENIFDIRVGVAIIIAIKASHSKNFAKVFYGDVYGLRENKFSILESKQVEYKEIIPDNKTASFIPCVTVGKDDYNNGISLTDLFIKYSIGIVMGRDNLCVQNTQADIEKVLYDMQTKDPEQLRQQYGLGKDTRDWTVKGAIDEVEKQDGEITQIAYRPFDSRWTYFTGKSKGFHCMPRGEVMQNFIGGENVGIIFVRGDTNKTNSSAFIVNSITDNSINISQSSGVCSVAPLFIKGSDLINEFTPNFNPKQLDKLTQNLTTKPTQIQVFDYCYGVLYDPNYREKYNEFLKRDYPKVPIIENETMFKKYTAAGEKLRKLHLMQTNAELDLQIDGGDLEIGAIKYINSELWINKTTKIIGIPNEVYNYFIGGYQVLSKWFKNHKGEELTIENFEHIKKVAGILAETIKVQKEIAQ
jgi:predicted helicase